LQTALVYRRYSEYKNAVCKKYGYEKYQGSINITSKQRKG